MSSKCLSHLKILYLLKERGTLGASSVFETALKKSKAKQNKTKHFVFIALFECLFICTYVKILSSIQSTQCRTEILCCLIELEMEK